MPYILLLCMHVPAIQPQTGTTGRSELSTWTSRACKKKRDQYTETTVTLQDNFYIATLQPTGDVITSNNHSNAHCRSQECSSISLPLGGDLYTCSNWCLSAAGGKQKEKKKNETMLASTSTGKTHTHTEADNSGRQRLAFRASLLSRRLLYIVVVTTNLAPANALALFPQFLYVKQYTAQDVTHWHGDQRDIEKINFCIEIDTPPLIPPRVWYCNTETTPSLLP